MTVNAVVGGAPTRTEIQDAPILQIRPRNFRGGGKHVETGPIGEKMTVRVSSG
jgi:hypothetical protein